MKWLVKREDYVFDYSMLVGDIPSGSYKNKLHNLIAEEGQAGWEPWNLSLNVVGGNVCREFYTVWYKRPEEAKYKEFLKDGTPTGRVIGAISHDVYD